MSSDDTRLETCIKCKHMTMEAPMGMPYFICDMNLDMENEACEGFTGEGDPHETAFNHR